MDNIQQTIAEGWHARHSLLDQSEICLANAIDKLTATDIELTVGLGVEFHIFESVTPKLAHHHATMPGQAVDSCNCAQRYQLLTEPRYHQLESIMHNLRRHSVDLFENSEFIRREFGDVFVARLYLRSSLRMGTLPSSCFPLGANEYFYIFLYLVLDNRKRF